MKYLWSVIIVFIVANVLFANDAKREFMNYLEISDYENASQVIPELIKNNSKDVQLHLLAGDVYLELREYKKAHDLYEKANDLNRREPNILRKLAVAKSYIGDYDEAIEILDNIIRKERKDENNIENFLTIAEVYIRADSTNQAELFITRANRIDKDNPKILASLGDLYFAREVYQLAKMNYEKALEIEPAMIDARMKLATSYFWLANKEADDDLSQELFRNSLREWNTITQMDPNNATAQYEQGFIFFLASQYDRAALSFNNYIQLRPSDNLARWYLAQSLENVGRCDSAITHLEIVRDNIDSVKTKAELYLARCYFDLENYDKAIESYNALRNDTTLLVRDVQKLGQAHLIKLDTAKALEIWYEAVEMDPEQNCRIMEQMGYILQRQNKHKETIDILEKRLETSTCPDDKEGRVHIVYYLIGSSYLFDGQPENAVEYLIKASEIDNEFYFAMINLGDAYAQMEQFEKADSTFNFVIDNADTIDSKFALQNAYSKLAGIKLDNKEFKDVIRISQKWADVFSDSPYPYLYIAISYHNLQDGPNACRYYRRVLSIQPDNSTASSNLNMLQQNNQCTENDSQ